MVKESYRCDSLRLDNMWPSYTGLTFELDLWVSHDFHPIRCAVNGSPVQRLGANRLLRNMTRHTATVGVLCLRDLKGMRILQQME